MKYKVTHTTTYEYSETVPLCQNEARLAPRNLPGQVCRYHRLVIRPEPASLGRRIDYFGNTVHFFSIHAGHRRLSVTSISKLDLERPAPPLVSPAWESVRESLGRDRSLPGLDAYQFCFDSPHAAGGEALAEYAGASFLPGRPIIEAAAELNRRIHADFTYDTTATTVSTPLEEVFRKRRGVCQDLAHVALGCLRSLGLSARYVSGYLRTHPLGQQPQLVGADASHAWIAVYCGPAGWVDFDPTNNVEVVGEDHITVAWGRDYGDVCPINGTYIGGGQHNVNVAVTVAPLE